MAIGLALSGGGSRAMAFHLGCLRTLHDRGVLEDVSILSTISGGSVIGGLYAYRPDLSFEEFDKFTQEVLKAGFARAIVSRLIHPRLLFPCLVSNISGRLANLVKRSSTPTVRAISRTDAFEEALRDIMFNDVDLSSPTRGGMEVVIGTCELSTGTAFRFGSRVSGGSWWGEVEDNKIPLSLAVAASAAYPLLLPALDKEFSLVDRSGETQNRRLILTDGGVYDNMGIACLSPRRISSISTHAHSLDYIIACNASAGKKSKKTIPWGVVSRVHRTFNVIHRRVQDSTMGELHQWKEAGQIKGFILPYLGQNDRALPFQPPHFVKKSEVEDYATDFNPMSNEWINKLSLRGEQLTRVLLQHYLPDL